MYCAECGEKTKVIDTASADGECFRKRKCEGCGKVFITMEVIPELEDFDYALESLKQMRNSMSARSHAKKRESLC